MTRLRFSLENDDNQHYRSGDEQQQGGTSNSSMVHLGLRRNGNIDDTSCRLVTLSHDSRSMHTLLSNKYIESKIFNTNNNHTRNTNNDIDSTESSSVIIIKTELPEIVQGALNIDSPIELVCVDTDESSSSHKQKKDSDGNISLPLLCLYTCKSVFLLELAYKKSNYSTNTRDVIHGHVVSVKEPYERYLDASTGTTILRVRPPPSHTLLVPAGCLAALTENLEICEYSILLYHCDGTVTAPLYFRFEDVVENERYVDFCFAQSSRLSLLTAMSIILLKSSGDLLAASPFVFEGSVTSKSKVDESLDFLESEMEKLGQDDAKWRQCKLASQFLVDVFCKSENRGNFGTAHVLHQPERHASQWPLQLQGPVLFHSSVEPGPSALTIESFGSSDCMVGLAIGKDHCHLDFAVISPTALLPRFAYESRSDSNDIDDFLFKLSAFVERVSLVKGYSPSYTSITLVADPIMETLLHFATPASVFTISTNAMRMTSRKLKGLQTDPVHTNAWLCLSSNTADLIQGIVVPADAVHMHELHAVQQSGSVSKVDVSESKFLHEFKSIFAPSESLPLLKDTPEDQSVPLYEEIRPLVERVHRGLSGMTRFVGSETNFEDISPDVLAVAIRMKKRCDDEVVLPLLELEKTVDACREDMKMRLKLQHEKLKSSIDQIKKMKKRLSTVAEAFERAESNSVTLSQRSFAALHASKNLMPTITKAEYEYFNTIKRLELKCKQMEKEVKRFTSEIQPNLSKLEVSDSVKNISPDKVSQANLVLNFTEKEVERIKSRFEESDVRMKRLLKENNMQG